MKWLNATDTVKNYLETYPSFRDSDMKLMSAIWREQLNKHGLSRELTIDLFANYLINGVLYKPETIRRSRAKLQEIHPHLRGEAYEARHRLSSQVRQELREIK